MAVKTVPNQKKVRVNKEVCNQANIYAAINIAAMEQAAQKLDAGAFKLWIYFAKNQNAYEFALSSSEVEKVFGMKIKQYSNAVKELIEKGYLVEQSGNAYNFFEVAVMPKEDNEKESVMPKGNNAVMPKKDNGVMPKGNNALLPQRIRNNTNTTLHNTEDITKGFLLPNGNKNAAPSSAEGQKPKAYQKVSKQWLEDNGVEYKLQVANLGYVVATGALIEVI